MSSLSNARCRRSPLMARSCQTALSGFFHVHHWLLMSSGSVIVQFGVRARGMRVTAPSGPTIQTLRGAQLRSTNQTFSGSGMRVLSAPLSPARNRFRTADDGRAFAPGRVPGQDDGSAGGAGLIGVKLAAVVDPLFEDVGVNAIAGRRAPGGVGVPGMVLPGRDLREAVVGVVAGVEVDVAGRVARLERKGPWRPFQVAGRAAPSTVPPARTIGRERPLPRPSHIRD